MTTSENKPTLVIFKCPYEHQGIQVYVEGLGIEACGSTFEKTQALSVPNGFPQCRACEYWLHNRISGIDRRAG